VHKAIQGSKSLAEEPKSAPILLYLWLRLNFVQTTSRWFNHHLIMSLRFSCEDLRAFLSIPQGRFNYYSTDTMRTYMPTASEDHLSSTINAIKGAFNDTPEGDSLNPPGVRQLPLDGASGKLPLEVDENSFPRMKDTQDQFPGLDFEKGNPGGSRSTSIK
jgi:hypothetical protein